MRPAEYVAKVAAGAQQVDAGEIGRAVELLSAVYEAGRAVYIIGNGGSASTAMHFAQDLAYCLPSHPHSLPFRVVSLCDNIARISAIANDMCYERVFEVQLRQFAEPDDVLIAISGSGNSENILRAASYARSLPAKVIGFTGFDGGKLIGLSDIRLHVPLSDLPQVEIVHCLLLHLLSNLLGQRLRGPKSDL